MYTTSPPIHSCLQQMSEIFPPGTCILHYSTAASIPGDIGPLSSRVASIPIELHLNFVSGSQNSSWKPLATLRPLDKDPITC
jgi:hypothetical protein